MLGALVPGIVLFAAICARGRGILFASSLALFVLGLGAIELFDQVQIRKTTAPSLSAMVEDMCRRGDTIWMYDGILASRYYRLPMPKAAAVEVATYFARADKADAPRNWLTIAKVNPVAAGALQTDFDEEEQVHLARGRRSTIRRSCVHSIFSAIRATPTPTNPVAMYVAHSPTNLCVTFELPLTGRAILKPST